MTDRRELVDSASRHGAAVPRGLDAPTSTGRGRFGKMFPGLPVGKLTDAMVAQLLSLMTGLSGDSGIRAGYTYLGQFIDHDVTYDPSTLAQRTADPTALVNFRTPRLDLDSLYGSGPVDQPYLYEWCDRRNRGVKLLFTTAPATSDARLPTSPASRDLPRNAQGRALIGDPRNDENAIVAQLHLLLIEFHNAVVELLRERGVPEGPQLFAAAQQFVRWHYQWIVVDDFLPTVVGRNMTASVLRPGPTGPTVHRKFFKWDREPFMPVEFSGAAYRFGHSMVRGSYQLQPGGDSIDLFASAANPDDPLTLQGLRPLLHGLEIDWRMFFAVTEDKLHRQEGKRIDPVIETFLTMLPARVGGDPRASLPELNLRRGLKLELPTGPAVATAMEEPVLTPSQRLLDGIPEGDLLDDLRDETPLWFYILCEAAAQPEGVRLGRVGGRIVAEVLVGLLEADPSSYLSVEPAWAPDRELTTDGRFGMAELVRFVHRTHLELE